MYNWLVLNYDAHAFFQLPSRDILFEETHDIFPFVVGNKLSTFFTGLPRFHSNAARDGFHTTYSWNIKWQKCEGMGLNGFIFKKRNEIKVLKQNKKNPGNRLEVAC